MSVAGIILAAGRSTRMGRRKQELPFQGSSLANTVLDSALQSRLDYVFMVVNEQDAGAGDKPSNGYEKIVCREASKGQAFSLRTGVKAAMRKDFQAVVILLADQPLVSVRTINRIISMNQMDQQIAYIAASSGERKQPPVLFPEKMYSKLMELEGDKGARSILQDRRLVGVLVQTDPIEFMDVDTEGDYEWLLSKWSCDQKILPRL